MPVGILVANPTVRPMNDDFALLVDRDLPCSPFGISLGRMDRGCPLIPFATHGPFVTVRNDMLILPAMLTTPVSLT